MEKRRTKGELLENEDALINAEIIDHLTEALLENVFVGLMFEMHRNIAINKLVGLREELLSDQPKDEIDRERKAMAEEPPQCTTNGRTAQRGGKRSNGGRSRGVAECKCKCFVCQQMIAAVRFAPHLEKCIGIGRTARSRRRGVTSTFMSAASDAFSDVAELSSPSRSTRSSTLRSAARRLLSSEDAMAVPSVASSAISSAAPPMATTFLSRRRTPMVAEDFTLPTASSAMPTVTAATKLESATQFYADGAQQNLPVKAEEGDEMEEPLRDRLRNKTSRSTNFIKK